MSKRRKGDTSDQALVVNEIIPDKTKGRIKVSGCKLNSVQLLRKDTTANSDVGESCHSNLLRRRSGADC